jgi:hypothetical protein
MTSIALGVFARLVAALVFKTSRYLFRSSPFINQKCRKRLENKVFPFTSCAIDSVGLVAKKRPSSTSKG